MSTFVSTSNTKLLLNRSVCEKPSELQVCRVFHLLPQSFQKNFMEVNYAQILKSVCSLLKCVRDFSSEELVMLFSELLSHLRLQSISLFHGNAPSFLRIWASVCTFSGTFPWATELSFIEAALRVLRTSAHAGRNRQKPGTCSFIPFLHFNLILHIFNRNKNPSNPQMFGEFSETKQVEAEVEKQERWNSISRYSSCCCIMFNGLLTRVHVSAWTSWFWILPPTPIHTLWHENPGFSAVPPRTDLSGDRSWIPAQQSCHGRLEVTALPSSRAFSYFRTEVCASPLMLSLLCFAPAAGVGGNLVAIQASRISTYLHFWSIPGVLPYKMRQNWPNPCTTFFSSGASTRLLRKQKMRTSFYQNICYPSLSCSLTSSRRELQVSAGAADAGRSGSPGLPLRHLPAAGRGGAHLCSLHPLLPMCCSSSGETPKSSSWTLQTLSFKVFVMKATAPPVLVFQLLSDSDPEVRRLLLWLCVLPLHVETKWTNILTNRELSRLLRWPSSSTSPTSSSAWCGGEVWIPTTFPSRTWRRWATCSAPASWPSASALSQWFKV